MIKEGEKGEREERGEWSREEEEIEQQGAPNFRETRNDQDSHYI